MLDRREFMKATAAVFAVAVAPLAVKAILPKDESIEYAFKEFRPQLFELSNILDPTHPPESLDMKYSGITTRIV